MSSSKAACAPLYANVIPAIRFPPLVRHGGRKEEGQGWKGRFPIIVTAVPVSVAEANVPRLTQRILGTARAISIANRSRRTRKITCFARLGQYARARESYERRETQEKRTRVVFT